MTTKAEITFTTSGNFVLAAGRAHEKEQQRHDSRHRRA
jgi:hypothetical protein